MKLHTTTPPSIYQTDKLSLAAYLVAAGIAQLAGVSPIEGSGKVAFRLSEAPSPEQLARYFSGEATVSALRFGDALSNLKAAVFEAKRAAGLWRNNADN